MAAERSTFSRTALIAVSALFITLFILLPMATIVVQALAEGVQTFLEALTTEHALHALYLTLITTLIVVPLNTVFGVFLAYAVAKYDFCGKGLLTVLIDLPFTVSPVIAGFMIVLVFGAQGLLQPIIAALDLRIVFALPAIVMASAFVTFPFIAKSLIPLMQSLGNTEEEAALSLGAGAISTFFRVTLPSIRWGLFYGVVLTNARVIGEFGAVSVVSGKILSETATMPIYIELMYNEYAYTAAFAIASVLMILALISLVLKLTIERHERRRVHTSRRVHGGRWLHASQRARVH